MTRTIDLTLTPAGHTCKVVLDGEEVPNCRGITVRADVGELTTVTLELINVLVRVKGDVNVSNLKVVDVTALTDSNRKSRAVS